VLETDLVGLEDVSHLAVVLGVEHDQVAEEDFVNFGLSQQLMLDKRDSDVTSIDTVLFPNVSQHFDNQILF